MPTWSGVRAEIAAAKGNFDLVRRKYLEQLHAHTGRAVIVYATKWTIPDPNVPPELLGIHDGDLPGFMECMHQIENPKLDLILHSPGGDIHAASAIVSYLRTKFKDIRVIVPGVTMSAAAMMACAADRIVMGKHSFLGPADPQIALQTRLGHRQVAMQSITDQFNRAAKEIEDDPSRISVWAPLLEQYGPDLLVQAERASELSKTLVRQWLASYMFAQDGIRVAAAKAKAVANWLCSHSNFNSHGRHISRDELRARKLVVDSLEEDETTQESVLSLYHAVMITLQSTPAVKIIENHLGRAYINQINVVAPPSMPSQFLIPQGMFKPNG